MTAPLVELRGVSKRFGGVHAVERVDLELRAGEVIGLLGHNGAGKSTLMKILSGVGPADEGEIRIDGRVVAIRSPRDARALGIETIYQDLALADNLDATANLFLGRERLTRVGTLDEQAMERAARDVIRRVNPRFTRMREPVARLSGGERQSIAIARALQFDARVLILDEPTAALGPEESAAVGELIRRLRDEGVGVFVVSHDVHDVLGLADRVAVMRAGRLVGIRAAARVTHDEVLALILLGSTPPAPPGARPPIPPDC
jgi:D-xylose transport system ATP-binding protein